MFNRYDVWFGRSSSRARSYRIHFSGLKSKTKSTIVEENRTKKNNNTKQKLDFSWASDIFIVVFFFISCISVAILVSFSSNIIGVSCLTIFFLLWSPHSLSTLQTNKRVEKEIKTDKKRNKRKSEQYFLFYFGEIKTTSLCVIILRDLELSATNKSWIEKEVKQNKNSMCVSRKFQK